MKAKVLILDDLGLRNYTHEEATSLIDLAGVEQIEASHIAEAIQYRSLDRRM